VLVAVKPDTVPLGLPKWQVRGRTRAMGPAKAGSVELRSALLLEIPRRRRLARFLK